MLGGLAGVDEAWCSACRSPAAPASVLRAVVACRPGRLTAERSGRLVPLAPLAPHKVPRSVILVAELPRTDRGKLDRAALLALGRQRRRCLRPTGSRRQPLLLGPLVLAAAGLPPPASPPRSRATALALDRRRSRRRPRRPRRRTACWPRGRCARR